MKIYIPKIAALLLIFSGYLSVAQEVTITYGAKEIAINQPFTITVTVQNEALRSLSDYPDIAGLTKHNVSSSSTTNYINGRMSSSQSRIMNYIASKEGIIKIPPFEMTVNGKTFKSPGTSIKVGPPVKKSRRNFFDHDPFEDFFGRPKRKVEFVDVEADAFLALTTDKNEVYQGEGFTTTLAFYVSAKNRADMRFYDLGKQITEITSVIKPSNCWEESFNIENITGQPVTINNQRYQQYKVYQATFYPWNTESIEFPSVDLELIKYKVAKNRSFYGRNRQEGFQTFSSRPKTVKVKELPPHPLKDLVSVGNYRLKENIDKKELKTGESFEYTFEVNGIGNISAIEDPMVNKKQEYVNIYDPNKRVNINRSRNTVSGSKSFTYFGLPNEPGEYELKDLFTWIYFDPVNELYDTLSSNISINVSGESKKNESILASDMGSFYDKIEFEDNNLESLDSSINGKLLLNISVATFILLLLGFSSKQIIGQVRSAFNQDSDQEEYSLTNKPVKEINYAYGVQEEEKPSLFERIGDSTAINALGWGIILTVGWVFAEIVSVELQIPELLSYYFIPQIFIFPIAYFQVTKWINRKKGRVTYWNAVLALIFLYIPIFTYFNTISSNTEFYQLPTNVFGGLFILYGFLISIMTNGIFYFYWKNKTSVWLSFIPYYSYYRIAKIANCKLYWWEYFTIIFPVRFVQHLRKFQSRKNGLEVLSWLIPIIFMPVLLYDKSDK